MMLRHRVLGVVLLFGLASFIGGAVLVGEQQSMPIMRDREAFEGQVGSLYTEARTSGDYGKASRSFHALRIAQDTGASGWLDTGLSMIACGGVVAMIAIALLASRRARRIMAETHGLWMVASVAALASVLLGVGSIAQTITIFDRYEVPPWADSLGIPIMGAIMMTPILFVLILLIAGLPHLRRIPRGASLWVKPRMNAGGVIASFAYAAFSLWLLDLAVESFGAPVGWLIVPALALVIWLMFHARAVASA